MRLTVGIAAFAFAACCGIALGNDSSAPEQIHLALGGAPDKMAVTWVTRSKVQSPLVRVGASASSLDTTVPATTTTYTDGGWKGWIYSAVIEGLDADTSYYYKVGATLGSWSAVYSFKTAPASPKPFKAAVFGDMGVYNSSSTIKMMEADMKNGDLDIVLHVGDIAYADGYQPKWDVFMNDMQPIAAQVPYMVCPGNHEHHYNFSAYRHRFWLPGKASGSNTNLWYSADYSYAHLIFMSTEHYWDDQSDQYKWIVEDLEKAVKNRNQVPFIIFMGHRPMYCSSDDYYDCNIFGPRFRKVYEPLFKKYSVDIAVWGHVHSYERLWPVYNGEVTGKSYNNFAGTVHGILGTGGCDEGLALKWYDQPSWSADRFAAFGFTRWTFYNETTFLWEFVGEKGAKSSESFYVTRDDRSREVSQVEIAPVEDNSREALRKVLCPTEDVDEHLHPSFCFE